MNSIEKLKKLADGIMEKKRATNHSGHHLRYAEFYNHIQFIIEYLSLPENEIDEYMENLTIN